jgi:hypothetical protein
MDNRLRRAMKFTAPVLLIAILALALLQQKPSSFTLSDGSVLSVDSARFGRTNIFLDGTMLEKALRRVLPTNGLRVMGMHLQPPKERVLTFRDGEVLVLRLCLSSPNERSNVFFNQKAPEMAVLSHEAPGAHAYRCYLRPFNRARNGKRWYSYIAATAFPRQETQLRLDVLDRSGASLAKLHFRNPVRHTTQEHWSSPLSPSTNLHGLNVAFGGIRLPEPTARVEFGPLQMATLPVIIQSSSRILTNWTVTDLLMRDGNGNRLRVNPVKVVTNGGQECHLPQYLDPASPWRIDFSLTRDSDFDAKEIHSFTFSHPLTGQTETFGDYILYFSCLDRLAVTLRPTNSNVRLSFIDAFDGAGEALWPGSGNWGQHHFNREMEYRRTENGMNRVMVLSGHKEVTVRFAIHTNYHASVLIPGG